MKPMTALELVRNFDALPDDAVVSTKVTEILLNTSEWTLRRNPPLRRVQISQKRFGHRVGDIRALVRGASPPQAITV
jgi:hypothetical protein